MTNIVILVDAGYLFAQGSKALAGHPISRPNLSLKVPEIVSALTQIATEKGPDCRLLRIYWYDGTPYGRLSSDQNKLANSDDIKLRLGQINSAGQQKGVDSLIVTDLIELARNQAISDALLVSGDEDVRIGVQIAQSFGVRLHLLGIDATGRSQSPSLFQEVDTTCHWAKTDVERFLSVTQALEAPAPEPLEAGQSNQLVAAAREFADGLSKEQLADFIDYRKQKTDVPPNLDAKLLRFAKEKIDRFLEPSEKARLRAAFVDQMKTRNPATRA